MNCDEVSELLPAYVLGALDSEELRDIEAHLRAGREHDEELVELRATVFALDRFGEEPDLPALAPAASASARTANVRQMRRPALWQAAIAAVLVVLAFGAGWLASGLSDDGDDVSIVVQGLGGQLMALENEGSQDSVTVTMAGFVKLPESQVYQIWAVRDGEWLRIGLCNTSYEGGWRGDFEFRIRQGDEIALTVEPAGGSASPTSEPILSTSS